MKTITCPDCNQTKPPYANGLCQQCWRRRYHIKHKTKENNDSKEYYVKHGAEVQRRRAQRQTCDILAKHAKDHKNDDERLSTKFIFKQMKLLKVDK